MITAVDTNIIIDILEADPVSGPSSRDSLRKCLKEGAVIASDVVWAEVAIAYGDSSKEAIEALAEIGILFSPMTDMAALRAAQFWHNYRKKSGIDRSRIVADFLIGGHALVLADRLAALLRGHDCANV